MTLTGSITRLTAGLSLLHRPVTAGPAVCLPLRRSSSRTRYQRRALAVFAERRQIGMARMHSLRCVTLN